MTAERNRVISGTMCRILIDGRAVGYGTGITVSERYSREPVKVTGQLEAVEFKVVDYDCQVTIDRLYVPEDAAVDSGLFPAKGNNPEDHVTNLAALKPVSVTVEDGEKERILGIVEGLELESRDWRQQRGSLVTENFSGQAIRFKDGSEA